MPRIYVHDGVGGSRGSYAIEVLAGSTYSIPAAPLTGWIVSDADVDGVPASVPVTGTMPARDINVYIRYNRDTTGPVIPPPPPPPPVVLPPSGEYEHQWDEGTNCEIVRKDFGARYFWFARNKYTGAVTSGYEKPSLIPGDQKTKLGCYEPAPPTVGDWQQKVGKMISDLVGTVTDALSGMTSRLQALEDFLKDFWQKLEDWLVERILGIIWKALTAEKKV